MPFQVALSLALMLQTPQAAKPAPDLNAIREKARAKALDPAVLGRESKVATGCRPDEEGEKTEEFRTQQQFMSGATGPGLSSPVVDANPIPPADRAPKYFEGEARQAATAFTAVTLEGKKISVADQKGKVVVVFLFKPDCKYSADMLPEIIRLYGASLKMGFTVLPVSLGSESWARLKDWRLKNAGAIPDAFPVYKPNTDKGTGASALGPLRATPSTFILDREGRIAWRVYGAVTGSVTDKLNHILTENLGTTAPKP